MKKTDFGVLGLGVMGKNIALNFLDKGIATSVYNRTLGNEQVLLDNFNQENTLPNKALVFSDLKEFVSSLERPRKLLMMVPANVVDLVIEDLLPYLEQGDVLIDGGNSFFVDSNRRHLTLKSKDIHFVGMGISGGAKGARNGPSLMPSGSKVGYDLIRPFIDKIAAKDKTESSCQSYIGAGGAGHFIKMIHNGIEYAEMQLLAEVYDLLKTNHTYEEISNISNEWNEGDLSSFLLKITADIFTKKENDGYVLDKILDKAGSKGTGVWSSRAALDLGFPATMIAAAVAARQLSGLKQQRQNINERLNSRVLNGNKIDLLHLKNAYDFARRINHQQGFALLKKASKTYNWGLNLSEIARVWTNGCIIRSTLMEDIALFTKSDGDIMKQKVFLDSLVKLENSATRVLNFGSSNNVSLPAFSAALHYWFAITNKQSPANLIQAQRDYFGSHGFQRIDDTNNTILQHANWD